MPNTYTQCYVQIVFAVEKRHAIIHNSVKEKIEKYITGVIKNKNCKPLNIFCRPDHIHILIGLSPAISISELVKSIKISSVKYINENKLTPFSFNWQKGYGAFTYRKKDLPMINQYINNQDQHHKIKSFKEEYIELLIEYETDFKSEYLFEF